MEETCHGKYLNIILCGISFLNIAAKIMTFFCYELQFIFNHSFHVWDMSYVKKINLFAR